MIEFLFVLIRLFGLPVVGLLGLHAIFPAVFPITFLNYVALFLIKEYWTA